jgi:membrane protein YdbS with pleckstrin-like domain
MNLLIKPSSIINIGWIMVIPFGFYMNPFLGILTLLIFIYKMIEVYHWRYEFYDDTVVEKKGVFTITREEVYYNRIKSIMVEEPFLMRLVGLQIIHVITSEQFKPRFTFYAIEGGEHIKSLLDGLVKISRKESGLRELDIFNTN